MTERKFTPPTKFPADYVDGEGNKAVILGRGTCEEVPFIGYDAVGDPQCWTKFGSYYIGSTSPYDLQDIPEVTAELEQAEARIEALEGKLARAVDVLLEAVEPSELEEGEAESDDLMQRLHSLHKQATVERSHFYVGSCAKDAMHRIEELEAKLVEAERSLDISCVIIDKLMEDKDDAE